MARLTTTLRNTLRNRWLKRGAGSVAALMGVVVVAGSVWEGRSRQAALAAFPPPGRMVETEGGPLHVHCTGDGEPTVVLEAGASQPSVAWSRVQEAVSSFTRVCSYDRAGIGWSFGASGDAEPDRMVRRLREALQGGGAPPPFVLVGHSIGGPLAMIFGALYPDETAGYVFVDSADPDRFEMAQLRPPSPPSLARAAAGAMSTATARIGLSRWQMRNVRKPDHWPDSVFGPAVAFAPQSGPAGGREQMAAPDIVRLAAQVTSFGAAPVVVLTAESSLRNEGAPMPASEWEALRLVMQRAIAARSTHGDHRVVEGVGHNIHLDDPAAVTRAVQDVVEEIRRDR